MTIDRNSRFILWIDSVATILVCPQDEIWIGQAVPTSGTHLSFQATLRRRHAKLTRDRGSYWLTTEDETQIRSDGPWEPCPTEGTPLLDGQHILLAHSVNLQFCRPNPLTSTAILRYASNHRTNPRTDYAVLMSEVCLLGASEQNHVVIPQLKQATFFFADQALQFRSSIPVQHNGQSVTGQIQVNDGDRLENAEFGLTVEMLGATD